MAPATWWAARTCSWVNPLTIDILWDDEARTVVRYDFRPGWTLAEFDAAERRLHEMLAEVSHRVDVIAHFLPGSDPPVGSFARFKRAQDELPERIGVVVVTNSGPMIAALVTIFLRVYGQHTPQLWLAESLVAARHKLNVRA